AGAHHPLKQAPLGESKLRPFSADVQARLEKSGDKLSIAAYQLAYGGPEHADQALAWLEDLPAQANVLSERSYAYLVRGNKEQRDLEEALRLADAALALKPDHGPALWNRAVAKRELGLLLTAATDFEAVAKLGEPGWAGEAKVEAGRLRKQIA